MVFTVSQIYLSDAISGRDRALENLRQWLQDDRMPPPSQYPRLSDGTASTREEVMKHLSGLAGLTLPTEEELPRLRPLELGPRAEEGIGVFPARPVGETYISLVSTVDVDGNEEAGLRAPEVAVPLATYTGFNPRHPETGGEGQLLEYLGSTAPFPLEESTRFEGDRRRSISARYPSREDYLNQIREAANLLVSGGYLLTEDVPTCEQIAAERYDALSA